MRKLLLVTLGLLFGAALPLWAAPDPVIRESVAVCDPGAPTSCAKPTASGQFNVLDQSVPTNGTGGFTGSLSVGASSAQLLAASATRQYRLVVKNESTTASVAVCLGTCTAALNTSGSMTIGPGQLLTLSDAAYVPGDAINAIASAGSTPVTVWSK